MKIQIGRTKLFAIDKYGLFIWTIRASNDKALKKTDRTSYEVLQITIGKLSELRQMGDRINL